MARRDARALRDEVAEAIDKGKFKRAIECIQELEHLEPRDAAWPKRAAEVYRRLNKPREAVAAYERAVDRYAQNGFLVQAIAVCKQILQLDPQHSATLHRLAQMSEERHGSPSGARTLGRTDAVPELTIARTTGPIPRLDPATVMPPGRPVDMLDLPTNRPRPAAGTAPELSLPDDLGSPAVPEAQPTGHAAGSGAVAAPPPVPPPRPRRASPSPVSTRRRPDSVPPMPHDPGAPLDALDLSEMMPGAEMERGDDGTSSGIIVIPLDDMDDVSGPIAVEAIESTADDTVDVPYDALESPEAGDEPEPAEVSLTDAAADDDELAEGHALSAAAQRALGATPLLSGLHADELEDLIERLALVQLDPGQVLFREGDEGDSLYIVAEGEVAVISEGPPRAVLSRLLPGAFFGEIALITEQPRSATITAVTRTELLAIDRDVVRALVAAHPDTLRVILRFIKNRLVERVIQTSPLFLPFAEPDRRELADLFDFLEVEPGTALIREDHRPDGLYVILAGRAEAMRDVDGAQRSLGFLGAGEVFGEMALYGAEPSLVTVVARAKVLALRMPAATFREVIMTHPQVLQYVGDLAEERRRQLEAPQDTGDVVDLKLDLI